MIDALGEDVAGDNISPIEALEEGFKGTAEEDRSSSKDKSRSKFDDAGFVTAASFFFSRTGGAFVVFFF